MSWQCTWQRAYKQEDIHLQIRMERLVYMSRTHLTAIGREDEVALVLLLWPDLGKQQVYLTFVVYLLECWVCSEPGLG